MSESVNLAPTKMIENRIQSTMRIEEISMSHPQIPESSLQRDLTIMMTATSMNSYHSPKGHFIGAETLNVLNSEVKDNFRVCCSKCWQVTVR